MPSNIYTKNRHRLQLAFWFLFLLKSNMKYTRANEDMAILKGITASSLYEMLDSESVEELVPDGRKLIGPHHGSLLRRIEEFVEQVESSDAPAFEQTAGGTLKELPLARHFRQMPGFLAQEHQGWSYSPRVQRFFHTATDFPPLLYNASKISIQDGEAFNKFILQLRDSCRSKMHKTELRQQDFRSSRRFKHAAGYVEKLFSLCSRMIVIRLDLLYRAEGEPITLERALKDFAKLVNNRRHNKIFEHEVGYIRKLEYGATGDHYHFHVMFFFDGAEVGNDAYQAHLIDQYWTKITNGRGHCRNCNRRKHAYTHLGIGMVSHNDSVMRRNLLRALAYLAKKDQLVWVKPNQKVRTIECGRLAGRSHSGLGRPRRTTAADA